MSTADGSSSCQGFSNTTTNLTCIYNGASDNIVTLSYIYLVVFLLLTAVIGFTLCCRSCTPRPHKTITHDTTKSSGTKTETIVLKSFDPRDGSNVTRIAHDPSSHDKFTGWHAFTDLYEIDSQRRVSINSICSVRERRAKWDIVNAIPEGVPLLQAYSVRAP